MAKQKRLRKEAIKSFVNVTENPNKLKGKWRPVVFGNESPLVLELGCGHGNYAIALARQFPEKNFIGIDLKAARLWVGAKYTLEQGMHNVFFIRANILNLAEAFDPGDVAEVWITFPDPYPKKPRKRLTSARYLDIYRQICAPGARLHFKTDADDLYASTVESLTSYGCTILKNIADLYAEATVDDLLRIQTSYEKKHIANGRTIKYIQFSLPHEIEGEKSD
jgi:tRNA (guanine-N7-)-methyltransferase